MIRIVIDRHTEKLISVTGDNVVHGDPLGDYIGRIAKWAVESGTVDRIIKQSMSCENNNAAQRDVKL